MKKKENNNEKDNFINKLSDDKYKAKAELIIGFAFIIILFIYVRVAGIGNNYNYNDINSINTNSNTKEEIKDSKLITDKISDNYSFDIKLEYITNKYDNKEENIYNYKGNVYKDNKIIYKSIGNNTSTYYVKNDKFYIKNIDNIYEELPEANNDIFNLLDYKYLTLETVKDYINKAKLDHTTNYSNGNVSYIYNLSLEDIIEGYKGTEEITISIDIVDNVSTIIIDYTNLFKTDDDNIEKIQVTYNYSNINEVEEIIIDIPENNVHKEESDE